MLIDDTKYNWLRTEPITITAKDNPNTIEFEKALRIYRIEGVAELSIYEDDTKENLLFEGNLPFEPEIPIACNSLYLEFATEEEIPEITLITEAGEEKTVLLQYLNTTEGMDFISNGYNDDSTYCTDICKRYGKKKLLWFADKDKSLNYNPAADEMIITVHRWFSNKSCPGNWLYARLGDLATKVTANLGGSTSPTADNLYRVQVGAYKTKANAEAQLKRVKAAGFDTYMVQVDGMYKIQVGAYRQKANADSMMAKLKSASFDAFVTTKSGTAASSAPTKKSIDEIAREVIRGDWGNGADRKDRLTAAGYDYEAVQARVNALLG